MTTYLLAGGGTAGHVNPLLATADRLRERDPGAEILVLGTAEGLEARLVPERGYELLTIPRLAVPATPERRRAALPGPVARRRSTASRELLRERGVDVVVGFGGYAAAPAYLAARREKAADRHPRAERPAGAREPTRRPVHPLRRRHLRVDAAARRPTRRAAAAPRDRAARPPGGARRRHPRCSASTSASRPCSSPAARRARGGSTTGVSAAVAAILGSGWQVLHITGSRSPVEDPGLPGYHLLEYCDRMDLALAVADLAVSRAGADDGQRARGARHPRGLRARTRSATASRSSTRATPSRRAARCSCADADFDARWVETSLVRLLEDRALVADMAARMATIGALDGADRMVDLVLEARDGAAAGDKVA